MIKDPARFLRIILLLFFWTSPALAQDICVSSLPEGHDDFCEVQGPCGPGDGNCKNDVECVLGLECLVDAGLTYGLEPHVDVCGVRLGGMFYCAVEGPCEAGQGNCQVDEECQAGLACVPDVGADYGFAADVDVCAVPPPCEPGSTRAEACPVVSPPSLYGSGPWRKALL